MAGLQISSLSLSSPPLIYIGGNYFLLLFTTKVSLSIFHSLYSYFRDQRRRIREEEKAKVVAVFLGTYLNAAQVIQQQGCLEEKFLEEHPFLQGGGLVWCEPDDHPYFRSIHSAKCPFPILPFLRIILVENLQCGKKLEQFRPPICRDDLSL